MPNQKGSVKDRIRARFRFLQYKKAKRKKAKDFLKQRKKLEKERIKAEQIRLYGRSYNKVQVFGITAMGLLIGLFTPKSTNRKISDELEIIEKDMVDIFSKLEQDNNIENIYQKIDGTYQKLDDVKEKYSKRLLFNSFHPTTEQSFLKKIVQKQKELEVLNDICHAREKQQNVQRDSLSDIKGASVGALNSSSNVKNINVSMQPLKVVKTMNEKLKDYDKELEIIRLKVQDEQNFQVLYDYEFKIKQLKIRIQKILDDYEKLKDDNDLDSLENVIDIDVLDKYELRKNNKLIIKQIEKCKFLLLEMEKKKTLLSAKKIEKIEIASSLEKQQQEKKKDQEKEKKEKLQQQFDDVYLANKMIIEHIVKEKRNIDKLKKQLYRQPILTRKKSIFFYAKKFTSSVLHIGISILPFRYFKNRLMGTFISGLMMNNSLRSIRNIFLTGEKEISYLYYQNLANEIRSNQDCVKHINDICVDSLFQIREIRNYLNLHYSMFPEYDTELTNFYQELAQLELQLSSQVEDLGVMDRQYDVIKKRIKIRNDY